MKKILLILAVVFSVFSFSSCTEEPVIEAPSIVGNWKAEKVKIVEYFSNVPYYDTMVGDVSGWLGISFYYNFKADKTFEDKSVDLKSGSVTTDGGSYNLNGTNLTLNYKNLTTQDFESVTFDAKKMIMISYDPNKNDPDRTVMTWEWSRQ